MKNAIRISLAVATLLVCSGTSSGQSEWSSFQNGGQLVIKQSKLPLNWTPESVVWKTQLAGYGQSSPVIYRDSVYVCSVTGPNKDTVNVQSFSIDTGEQNWIYKQANSSPEKNTVMVSRAAPTPVVDDDGLVVFFEGGNVCALNHQGKVRWTRDLQEEFGSFKARHGLAASLEQNEANIFLWAERSDAPFVMAIDKASGKTVWKKNGLGKTSWSSPRLIPVDGQNQLVLSASGLIVGMDPETGNRLWEFDKVAGNTSSTPIPAGEAKFLIGAGKGRGNAKTVASCGVIQIKEDNGKFSANWLWTAPKASCTFGSPLATNGKAYFVNRTGIVHCHDLESGKVVFVERLASGSIWATPLANQNGLYFFGKNGTTLVIDPSSSFKALAKNQLWKPEPLPQENGQSEVESSDLGTAVLYAAASAKSMLLLRRGDVLYCVR